MTGLFQRVFGRQDPAQVAGANLTDAVMKQALSPGYYRQGLAEDSFEGRFAMAAMIGALTMRRLRSEGSAGMQVAEALGETLFDRFDYALREEGVGDSSIARKARKLGEEFYGFARALDGVLAGESRKTVPAGLADVLARNGLPGAPDRLAEHVLELESHLGDLPGAALLSGEVSWPQAGVALGSEPH